jgi:hypothetical protein
MSPTQIQEELKRPKDSFLEKFPEENLVYVRISL